MPDTDPFDELVARVKDITGLDGRKASAVAGALYDEDETDLSIGPPTAAKIVRQAKAMGYEFEEREPTRKPKDDEPRTLTLGVGITVDPVEVLSEVYMTTPRVLCQNVPVIGKAPEEAQELFAEVIEQLPEEARALLVKVDLLEGKATFWLRDEANDVDRPIGPIDLAPYDDADALNEAFMALLQRLPRVLAADTN